MFRYRLHSPDGDDLGEATYAVHDQAGGGDPAAAAAERLRVLDARPVRGGGRVAGSSGLLQVEAASRHGYDGL